LNPDNCVPLDSIIIYEQHLTFCQVITDSSKEVYQVRPVTLIYTEGVSSYNSVTEELEHTLLRTDTLSAYLIDGIYRSYFSNDSLKNMGILTTRPLIGDERIDTFNISAGYKTVDAKRVSWNPDNSSIEELTYQYGFELLKMGEWTWYFSNGQLKRKGHYSMSYDQSFMYADEECKGGPRTTFGYGRQHVKDGIWKEYDSNGQLIRQYVTARDPDTYEIIEIEKK